AYLYDRTTKKLLAKVVFNPGEGTLIGGSRFKPLDTPLSLPAGFQGTIVADGFGPNQLARLAQPHPSFPPSYSVPPNWSVNDVGGRLSFVAARFGQTAGQFPDMVDPNVVVPYAYAAGTFLVDHPAWFQTGIPAGGTYTVMISSDPHDLKDL